MNLSYIIKKAVVLVLLLLPLVSHFSFSAPLASVSTPAELLSGVGKANRNHNFRGLLTYEANGYMRSLRLTHDVENEVSHQRLEFLDGPKRQVVRRQGLYHCDSGATRWGLWPNEFNTRELAKAYKITLVGDERVAGRNASVVSVLPRDEYRYGYQFSIDKETGLLLKTLLIIKESVIERLQFVDISLADANTLGDTVSKSVTEVDTGYTLRVPEVEPCRHDHYQSSWRVTWLPKGFVSVGNRVTNKGEQVLMYSDGLATLSVFIHDKSYAFLPKGTARRGATVAVMSPVEHSIGSYTVIVVGEVPKITARQVAVSVRNRPVQ